MKKNNPFFITNSIIILLIVGVYIALQINELSFYREMAVNQAMNDVNLTATDVNSRISSLASEQVIISQMMANDMFLKEWCQEENGETTGPQPYKLYNYLDEYKHQYGYDNVFFVSNSTMNFYYDGGYTKTLDVNTCEHDSWYTGFLDKLLTFDTQVDTNELNDQAVSLFVNYLVQDKGFKSLGVVGVVRSLDYYQRKLSDFEKNYDVVVRLVDVSPEDNSYSGSYGYYVMPEDAAKDLNLTLEQVTRQVTANESYSWNDGNICTTIIYNSTLGWNIIVQKDVTKTLDSIFSKIYRRIGVVMIIILVYVIMGFSLTRRLSALIRKNENTDELTGLYNNKIFKEIFESKRRKKKVTQVPAVLFMVDVDDFKDFNDNFGHLYGNSILKLVAEGIKEIVGTDGMAARWGGDEFIGILNGTEESVKEALEYMGRELKKADTKKVVTLSCGLAKVEAGLSLEKNLDRVDEALYESKEKGKDQCTIYKG